MLNISFDEVHEFDKIVDQLLEVEFYSSVDDYQNKFMFMKNVENPNLLDL